VLLGTVGSNLVAFDGLLLKASKSYFAVADADQAAAAAVTAASLGLLMFRRLKMSELQLRWRTVITGEVDVLRRELVQIAFV